MKLRIEQNCLKSMQLLEAFHSTNPKHKEEVQKMIQDVSDYLKIIQPLEYQQIPKPNFIRNFEEWGWQDQEEPDELFEICELLREAEEMAMYKNIVPKIRVIKWVFVAIFFAVVIYLFKQPLILLT